VHRRAFLSTMAGGLLAAPFAADAQPAGKVSRIGVLGDIPAANWDAFLSGLREHGYLEGQNLIIERRSAQRMEQFSDLAVELVQLNVDLLLATNPPAALAAKRATATIPIVFVPVADPVGLGLVSSLARPGGNITGMAGMVREGFLGKNLELLKEVRPNASRVAILTNPSNTMHQPFMSNEAPSVAQALKVTLQPFEVARSEQLEAAFDALTRWRADLLFVFGDPVTFTLRTRVAELAARYKVPAMYLFREHVEAGGLMCYGPSMLDLYRRAASHVGKILKGAKPADLPVEQPTKFELVINLKTAKALGLTIPPSLLSRADEVIQ
jgi:putative ABC transport system substrate-binding protein